ncbi:MAG TPA: sigma-54 dependent transcriptional regulator [Candidatus Sumerlaeota bacterium]|nr:sigma-54 dependent transcriptional regulator [Candidatus Sumerlaeota bacterium]HPS00597.1 sigma-54 dependent transcriptional regulator [Candidatus Sumerlaeota bacterium]
MTPRILIVDDEVGMQIALREVLQRQGYDVTVAKDGLAALNCLEAERFDLLLSDVRMPEMTGMELLERVRVRWPQMPALIMTAYGTIEDAVDAMKKGAVDYLLKPFSSEAVEEVVAKHLQIGRETATLASLSPEDPAEADDARTGEGVDPIAISLRMRQVLALAREVADSTATVLIQGESGTGKEVLARYIHRYSGRSRGPFVALNCAALPEGLLESELFGHEKGSFTGAVLSRKGKFELANHGTLLLDEVSEMALPLQAKLLRALQEREIDPIGSQRPISLDVRVIATTNRNLTEFVEKGNFREDLYYRLQVISIEIPPLRDRPEDILPLAEFFVRRLCRVNRRPRKHLSEAMQAHLLERPWRGNVRELENFLERAVLLCKSDEITPDNIFLQAGFQPVPVSMGLPARPAQKEAVIREVQSAPTTEASAEGEESLESLFPGEEIITLEEMEKRLILRTLDRVNGNRTRAADLLGVSVRTIRNKLNLYGLGADSQEPQSAAL